MDPNLKDQTLNKLTKAENIFICAPMEANLDNLASVLALYLSIAKVGKNVQIKAKEPTVGEARQFYGVSKIAKNEAASKNLVVVIDKAIDTVDKITHFLDKDKLNVVIHSLPGSQGVTRDQISFENAPQKPDFVIAVGISSYEQLRKLITHEQNIDSNTWIVSITKGQSAEKYAQVNVASRESTSLSETTAQFIQAMALPVNEDIAFNLYTGIAHATANFSPKNISPLTFQIANWLVKFGAGRASLAKGEYIDQPSESLPLMQADELEAKPDVFSKFYNETPIEQVESEKDRERDWLKPPRIYKGSKSFDSEN